jgi:hypothetical protein
MIKRNKRRRLRVIDRQVQGALLLLTIRHWLSSVTLGLGLLFCWHLLIAGREAALGEVFEDVWSRYAPAVIVLLALSPAYFYGMLRASNRFVGPIFRFRAALLELAQGREPKPLRFREGDFWKDMAESFNAIVEERRAVESRAPRESATPQASVAADGVSKHVVA